VTAIWSILMAFAEQDLLPVVYLGTGLGILAMGMLLWGAEDHGNGR
jgi:predicted RNA methylase